MTKKTESLKDIVAEGLRRPKPGKPCFAEGIEGIMKAALDEWVKIKKQGGDVNFTAASASLKRHGYDVSPNTVTRHIKKTCKCYRD